MIFFEYHVGDMKIIFFLLPLVFFIITSYYFNRRKADIDKTSVIPLALCEALWSYLITIIFFLDGYLTIFGRFALIFMLMLIFGYIVVRIEEKYDRDSYLQIETVKNNLVLFATTVLPMYVFLTVFRFYGFVLQILFSILLTTAIFILSLYAKKLLTYIIEKFNDISASLSSFTYYLLIWLLILFIGIGTILFDLPTNKTKTFLNLGDNTGYLNFNGYPVDLENNFQTNNIMTVDIKKNVNPNSIITDYYYDDNYLYTYSSDSEINVYDLSTNKEIFSKRLKTEIMKTNATNLFNRFVKDHNYLLFYDDSGVYLVKPNTIEQLLETEDSMISSYYENNKLFFLKKMGNMYEVYYFSNGELILTEEINLTNLVFNQIVVISNTCFYKTDDRFTLKENPYISFVIKDGNPLYDATNKIMYYINILNKETIYHKVDQYQNTSKNSIYKKHNSVGLIIDDNIFTVEKIDDYRYEKIEILNQDLEHTALNNHHKSQRFWLGNKFYYYYIANYQEKDNNLEYLQVDHNDNNIVFSVIQLQKQAIDLKLPFYSHYGIGIFIPIIIFMFIPITNCTTTITVLDFFTNIEERRKKKAK